jgi:hypothetical protein
MPKAILQFNLPEEREEFNLTVKAGNLHSALWDILESVFRPARKHGYSDTRLQKLIQKLDACTPTWQDQDQDPEWPRDEHGPLSATDLVGLLEKRFHEILEQHEVIL